MVAFDVTTIPAAFQSWRPYCFSRRRSILQKTGHAFLLVFFAVFVVGFF